MKWVVIVLCLLCCISYVTAPAAGVSPGRFYEDFQPHLEKEYTFAYYFDGAADVEFYLSYGLAKYAEITNVQKALDAVFVTVKLSLPEKLDTPGEHILRVGGREVTEANNGIQINYDVGGTVRVFVPYPGKYAELDLRVKNANQGENIPYDLTIHSRGDEDLIVLPRVEISRNGNVLKQFSLETRSIPSKDDETYSGETSSEGFTPDDYNFTVYVDYGSGEIATQTKTFRIGELRIGITNYTRILEAEKVNRFQTFIESYWNDPIPGIYAVVEFPEYPTMNSRSSELELTAWKESILLNFIDTTGVDASEVQGTVTVHYADKTEVKDITIQIQRPTNWFLIGVVSGLVLGVLIIIGLIVYIIYFMKKNGTKKKKRK